MEKHNTSSDSSGPVSVLCLKENSDNIKKHEVFTLLRGGLLHSFGWRGCLSFSRARIFSASLCVFASYISFA